MILTVTRDEAILLLASLKQIRDSARQVSKADIPQRIQAAAHAAELDTLGDKLWEQIKAEHAA